MFQKSVYAMDPLHAVQGVKIQEFIFRIQPQLLGVSLTRIFLLISPVCLPLPINRHKPS